MRMDDKRVSEISRCGYCNDLYLVKVGTPKKEKVVSNTFIRCCCIKNAHLRGLTVLVPKEKQLPRSDPGHASFLSRNVNTMKCHT